jgi:hypothetical protein
MEARREPLMKMLGFECCSAFSPSTASTASSSSRIRACFWLSSAIWVPISGGFKRFGLRDDESPTNRLRNREFLQLIFLSSILIQPVILDYKPIIWDVTHWRKKVLLPCKWSEVDLVPASAYVYTTVITRNIEKRSCVTSQNYDAW